MDFGWEACRQVQNPAHFRDHLLHLFLFSLAPLAGCQSSVPSSFLLAPPGWREWSPLKIPWSELGWASAEMGAIGLGIRGDHWWIANHSSALLSQGKLDVNDQGQDNAPANDKRDLFCVIALVPHQLPGKVDPRRWHCKKSHNAAARVRRHERIKCGASSGVKGC